MARVLRTSIKSCMLQMSYSIRWKWQTSKLIQINLKQIKNKVPSKQLQKIQNRRDKTRKVLMKFKAWWASTTRLKTTWNGSTVQNMLKLKKVRNKMKPIELSKKKWKEKDQKKTRRTKRRKSNDKLIWQMSKKKKKQDTIKSSFKDWLPSISSHFLRRMEEEFLRKIRHILPPDSFWEKWRRSEVLLKANGWNPTSIKSGKHMMLIIITLSSKATWLSSITMFLSKVRKEKHITMKMIEILIL